jgi:hypothetical protein
MRVLHSWTDDQVTQLSIRLEDVADEGDVVHSALMKLPPDLFASIAARSRTLARELIKAFSAHVRTQGWPFSYTDEIANVSRGLFQVLVDSAMRAELFEAVLMVGVGHNRYNVMSVAATLLEGANDPSDITGLARVLKNHRSEAESLSPYFTRSNLHPALRVLIPKQQTR